MLFLIQGNLSDMDLIELSSILQRASKVINAHV